MRSALSVILLLIVVSGCAGRLALSDDPSALQELNNYAALQSAGMQSYGALLRAKISRDGKVDDLRAELFSQGDSLLSIYVRGFLGKSVFKAVLVGDSLAVYFPDRREHFFGLRQDLETGDLAEAGHLIDFLLTLASGKVPVPDPDKWQSEVGSGKGKLTLLAVDQRFQHSLETRWRVDEANFPHAQLEQLDWVSADKNLRINLRALDLHFNREIPPAKFQLKIPESSLALTEEELVEALTDSQQ
ncbi:MAG: hypothetical protein ABIJ61_12855 [bacterium]